MAIADFETVDHGSIVILTPTSVAARRWLNETAPDDAQWWGRGLVVEPRYLDGVLSAAVDAGFNL